MEYRWNFGDNDSAYWAYGTNAGSSSKSESTGGIAAHVFEAPGTYTTLLSVFDGTHTASRTFTITVTDPDVVYAVKTTCISSGTDFTGAPAGATHATSSDFTSAIATALASGAKRVLFKRGDNFNLNTGMISNTTGATVGPITIGAFGSGNRPHVTATAYNISFIAGYNMNDWRIMDLEFDGAGMVGASNTQNVLGLVANGVNNLALRVYCHDVGTSFMMSGTDVSIPCYAAIVDCQSYNLQGFLNTTDHMMHGCLGFYNSGYNGVAVMGSSFDNNGHGEYNVRFQGGVKTIFAHNFCGRGGDAKSSWTLRGSSTYQTQYHVISDNVFDCSTSVNFPWGVSISPQNNSSNEYITDAIFERNLVVGGGMYSMLLEACYCTVRNNLFDGLSYVGTGVCLTYNNNTAYLPQLTGNCLYNNSFYSANATNYSAISIITQGLVVLATTVKNNVAYAPHALKNGPTNFSSPEVLSDYGSGTIASGNSTAVQVKNINPFVGPMPASVLTNWALAVGCYAAGTGVPVPVWSDFSLTPLDSISPRDIGAIAQ